MKCIFSLFFGWFYKRLTDRYKRFHCVSVIKFKDISTIALTKLISELTLLCFSYVQRSNLNNSLLVFYLGKKIPLKFLEKISPRLNSSQQRLYFNLRYIIHSGKNHSQQQAIDRQKRQYTNFIYNK